MAAAIRPRSLWKEKPLSVGYCNTPIRSFQSAAGRAVMHRLNGKTSRYDGWLFFGVLEHPVSSPRGRTSGRTLEQPKSITDLTSGTASWHAWSGKGQGPVVPACASLLVSCRHGRMCVRPVQFFQQLKTLSCDECQIHNGTQNAGKKQMCSNGPRLGVSSSHTRLATYQPPSAETAGGLLLTTVHTYPVL